MTAPAPTLAERIRALSIPHDLTDEEVTGYLLAKGDAAALAGAATPTAATITRHDWFAGQALAGICAGYFANEAMTGTPPSVITDFARECADAMVETLK